MIETTVLDYLNAHLTESVYMEVPPEPPTSYVVVQKTGSSKVNHLKTATFAIQSISTSKYNAAVLNESVKSTMEQMIERNDISRVSLNSDYDFTDTQKKIHRYQAVFDLVYFE